MSKTPRLVLKSDAAEKAAPKVVLVIRRMTIAEAKRKIGAALAEAETKHIGDTIKGTLRFY